MLARILRIALLWELAWVAGVAVGLHVAADLDWGWSLLAGAATPFAVHAAIVALGFAGALRHARAGPHGGRLGASGAARAIALEFLASARAFQFEMPLTPRRVLPGENLATSDPVPVLLVHGYLCNRQVWRPLARFLAARGHAIGAVDLEPVFGSIDDYGRIVREGIDRLRARTGAPRVALVCHSMGGLATRACVRDFGMEGVERVVTIGSPHQGTLNAHRGLGRNAAQMRPGSDWLAALEASEGAGLRERLTVILSRHDNVVVPQALQTLPGARTIVFDGIGHVRLLSDPRVQSAVARALAG